MNCYDCQQLSAQTPAVGTCAHCGMGVCSRHGEVVRPAVRRFSGMTAARVGRGTPRIVCPACLTAGQTAPVPA
ncbi:DUF2180 family protein [Streptomyces sp. NPDC047002]|uniref:DUF2180 family protein n=1 Tax=Streptomyces sp. NPDC047002 TaxID=3155475 RepID=UPI003454A199